MTLIITHNSQVEISARNEMKVYAYLFISDLLKLALLIKQNKILLIMNPFYLFSYFNPFTPSSDKSKIDKFSKIIKWVKIN